MQQRSINKDVLTDLPIMVKVTQSLNVQQIGKGYVKYIFKKDYFADIKNRVRRDFNDTGKFLNHKVKRARYTKVYLVCMTYLKISIYDCKNLG